jgi:hypothetical protein
MACARRPLNWLSVCLQIRVRIGLKSHFEPFRELASSVEFAAKAA